VKVLFVSGYPPHVKGGVASYTQRIAEIISKKHEVTVVSPWDGEGMRREQLSPNLTVHFVGRMPHQTLKLLLTSWKHGRSADVVHTDGLVNGLVGLVKPGTPLVVTVHGHADKEMEALCKRVGFATYLKLALIERLIVWRASAIVAVSMNLRDRLSSRLSAEDSEKVVYIPNGVDFEAYANISEKRPSAPCSGLKPDSKIILFVKKVSEINGIRPVISAMPNVLAKHPDAVLVVVGDGSILDEMKSLASSLGVAGSVHFAGNVGKEEVAEWLGRAEVFCAPSGPVPKDGRLGVGDNLGISHLEAMSAGVATVAANGSLGKGEFVEGLGSSIMTVAFGDAKSVTNALTELLGDAEKRSRLGTRGRLYAKGYSWMENAKAIEQIYIVATEKDNRRHTFQNAAER
jgi:phosphatidylinositol alpha-1,6-mannosyltransferase